MFISKTLELNHKQKGSDCIKNRKEIILIVLGILFCLIMSISGVYALVNQETNGAISTDIVDIEICTYKLNSSNEEVEFGSLEKPLYPGDEINMIPKVVNHGMDCYLRIKIKYVDDSLDFTNYTTGFSTDFEKHGEYYYYKKTLYATDSVKLFDSIKVPNASELDVASGKIELDIVAEAVQEKNFSPDYTKEDPWNNIEPTKSVNTSYSTEDPSKISVKYEDGTDKDITVPNDFLEDAKKMIPGDTYTDTIEINNTSKSKAKYYLNFNYDGSGNKEIELLKQIDLVITDSKGNELYRGKLYSTDSILLGEYNLAEKDKLSFKISVPSDLSNEYANLNPKMVLTFSSDFENKNKEGHNTKTGDQIDLVTTIFLLSSIGLIIVMLLYRRENKKVD